MTVSRTARALATVVAVAALAVVAVVLLHSPSSGPVAEPSAPAAVAPALVAPAPVATTPTKPVKPAPRHDRVPAAAPTFFRITGPAFTITAPVCGMPYVRPLNPPGDQARTVCWVENEFGVAPGTDSKGTSYVLGHAWSQSKLIFNPMSEFATAHMQPKAVMESGVATYPVPALKGYTVRLATPNGKLTYRVTRAYLVGKLDAAKVGSLMAEQTPNRVVLITCAVKDGVDLDQNVIVYATLVSSVAA